MLQKRILFFVYILKIKKKVYFDTFENGMILKQIPVYCKNNRNKVFNYLQHYDFGSFPHSPKKVQS